MKEETTLVVNGVVVECLPDTQFRVKLDETGVLILCHVSGKIRKNKIRIIQDDKVSVEMSVYDMTKGRITFRHK